MKLPLSLRTHYRNIQRIVNNNNIDVVGIIYDAENNGMTVDTLVGIVSRIMSKYTTIANDGSFEFKQALMSYVVNEVVGCIDIKSVRGQRISSDGKVIFFTSHVIDSDTPEPADKQSKVKVATDYQDYVSLKGCDRRINNCSTEQLGIDSETMYIVKNINPELIYLYGAMKYSETVETSTEHWLVHFNRMKLVCEQTSKHRGLVYLNLRKYDRSGRDNPLQRFGYAYEYGDSFEKHLIQVNQKYTVTAKGVKEARAFLVDEYGINSRKMKATVDSYKVLVEQNLKLYQNGFNKKYNAPFTIGSKELGKYLYIIEVYDSIVCNVGGKTRTRLSFDLRNSGWIHSANQFGGSQAMESSNLSGNTIFDTHQELADDINKSQNKLLTRIKSKDVSVGPNHGGTIKSSASRNGLNADMLEDSFDNIFGENYRTLRVIAEYGKLCHSKGHNLLKYTSPDGVVGMVNSYQTNCPVTCYTEDGDYTIHAIMPLHKGKRSPLNADGQCKDLGLNY